jgi:L-lactate dehydrogenase (cytochrome)
MTQKADVFRPVMRDEIETTLRLLGVNSLKELGPHLINTRPLEGLLMQPTWGPEEKKSP